MSKSSTKSNKRTKQFKAKTKTPDFVYFLGTIFIVLFVYSFSLFRHWLPFDEGLIYKETFFPIPVKFDEISEIIKNFILKSHILSCNTYFSNIATLRSNPNVYALIVFITFFFQKNACLYHLLQLFFHLINTTLVYLILKKTLSILDGKQKTTNHNLSLLIVSFFTLLWGLHSANSEAVLLVTNLTAVLTYIFCFCFTLYEISKIERNIFHTSKREALLISILFLILMFLTEYGYPLPLILFFISFAYGIRNSFPVKEALKNALKITFPYLTGLILFILVSFTNPDSAINSLLSEQNTAHSQLKTSFAYTFIERNLWLVPQLFVHFLKLLFFPKTLSLYQSNLVPLSDSLTSAYSLICLSFYLFFLLAPITLFLLFRRNDYSFICILIYAFYFSVFPFLHIVSPIYCLSADRYCYFPSFVLLFILIQPFYLLFNKQNQKLQKSLIIFILLIVLILGSRTLIRIQDWNSFRKTLQTKHSLAAQTLSKLQNWNDSIHSSAVSNLISSGQKLIVLAEQAGQIGDQRRMEELLKESLIPLSQALELLNFERNINEPITLRLYGLDYKSLILKSAYSIATIENDNYHKDPNKILEFLNPYFENNLKLLGISQLTLYSELLVKTGSWNKVKEVLEYGYSKYDYSDEISNQLADYYLFYENNFEKGFKILQHAYKYFPNNVLVLDKLLKYYEYKNDPVNQARFAYLIGLREHLPEGYQKACKIYLDINQLSNAKKSLKKLIILKSNSSITQELKKRYLELSNETSID